MNDVRTDDRKIKAEEEEVGGVIYKSIIIACILGILLTLALVGLARNEENFSVLYIKPDSYSNYVTGHYTEFTYAVENHESGDVVYHIYFYLDLDIVGEKRTGLKKDKVYEENKRIPIPGNLTFPCKVRVVLKSYNKEYETHYWLKGYA